MNLYLLRHGLAVEPGAPGYAKDSARPLTPEGERKLRRIGKAMKAQDLSFDLILSSPYVRARQTAEIVAEALGLRKRLECTEDLTPGGSRRSLIASLNQRKPQPEEVLLVGHEPYLSEFISLLLSGETDLPVVMKKGGLCKLSIPAIEHGQCASLEWLLTPRQMTQMG